MWKYCVKVLFAKVFYDTATHWCVVVCCSVLQTRCVAVCCSVLQCVAVYCSVLQCVADLYDIDLPVGLSCRALADGVGIHIHIYTTHCNTLQHTATHCKTLIATHRNTLQHAHTREGAGGGRAVRIKEKKQKESELK